MSLNNFIYDLRAFKYRCIQAYFYAQLEEAEKMNSEGTGIICVTDKEFVRAEMLKIMEIIKSNNNDYESISKLASQNPFIKPYYSTICDVVKNNFEVGCSWIPSLLCIEVLRLFKEKGYTDFKDIDFLKLEEYYQKFNDKEEKIAIDWKNRKIKKSIKSIHFECAKKIVETLTQKKVFKKKFKGTDVSPKNKMRIVQKRISSVEKQIKELEEKAK